MLTGGQVADCTAGAQLLERLPACRILHGDKGYDSDAIRRQVEENGTMPNIPPKANRRWKTCFSPALYRCSRCVTRQRSQPQATGRDSMEVAGKLNTGVPSGVLGRPSLRRGGYRRAKGHLT